jgi:hypothetical protein
VNVTDRDDGDAADGHDKFAVLLDALDVTLGARVDAAGHAHAVARVVLGRVGAEILDVAAGVGRGDEDEGPHLLVADGTGNVVSVQVLDRVVHEVRAVVALEADEPLRGAAHEHQRGDEGLLGVAQAAVLVRFDGVDGDVAFDPCRQQGLQVDDPVVEHLEGVPVESVRGWFDQMWVGHGVRRTFLLLPGMV